MKITVGYLVCFLVYTFLFVVSLILILSGPFSDYICKEHLYVQSYQKVDKISFPLKWPDLIICKSPLNKNEQKYHDFMNMKYGNEEEFENLTNEVFFTKPEGSSSLYFQLKGARESDNKIHDISVLWLFFEIFALL